MVSLINPKSNIPESHSPAEKMLLVAHFLSEDGKTDYALAIYEFLVELGDTTAMTRMADILSEPPDFIDVTKAKDLYLRACVAGDYAGCHNLGVLCQQLGDPITAQKYFLLAAQRGAPQDE